MDLRLQVEELRRRLEGGAPEQHRHQHGVEVIDVGEGATVAIPVSAVPAVGGGAAEPEQPPATVVWREGMTMADVEKATIATVLELARGRIVEGEFRLDPFWIALFCVGLLTHLTLLTLKKRTRLLYVEGR